jgi:type II secretory pathway component PulF
MPPDIAIPTPPKPPSPKGPAREPKATEPATRRAPSFFSQIFEKVALQDKINFARHMALVIQAGLPIYEGLQIIRTQTESKVLARVVDDLMDDVNNGRFLADGLERYQYLFGDFFINIVRVGESSGTLAKNLMYLSEELRRSRNLETKVRSAMVYPLVIMVATIGVSVFLTFYVFPKLIPVFAGLNIQLPFTTLLLLGILKFSESYGIYALIAIAAIGFGIQMAVTRIKAVRYTLDHIYIVTPVLSDVLIAINMVNFTRVLSLLLKSGIKITEALNITAATFENMVYRNALLDANEEIKKGGQLGTFIAKWHHTFPPLVSGMIAVGERTGNLDSNLEYLAAYYEDEIENRLRTLTALIEPIMLLIMGLLVGFIALSIITPIYSISQGIK